MPEPDPGQVIVCTYLGVFFGKRYDRAPQLWGLHLTSTLCDTSEVEIREHSRLVTDSNGCSKPTDDMR